MNFDEFKNNLIQGLEINNIMDDININDLKIKLLYEYMKYIIKKNKHINLTSITDEMDFIYKHYIDSLYITKYIKSGKLLDVGTGGGFPGIPLLIIIDNLEVCFLDARNKKLKVIEEFINKNNIKGATFIHTRVEELIKNMKYKKKFDYVTTRAVSNIKNIINFTEPFLNNRGKGIAMRGKLNKDDENYINKNKKVIKDVLNYKIIDLNKNIEYERTVLIL